MSDELGIPSALSARASLDVAISMGSHVIKHGGTPILTDHHHYLDETMEPSTRMPITETLSPTRASKQMISSQTAETTIEMSMQQLSTQITTSAASVDRNSNIGSNILPCTELAYDVSQTIEILQHHAGIPTHHDNNTINTHGRETDRLTFVEALSDADSRLKSCLREASVVRTALHSLRTEETLTEVALRDYDERPALHL